MPGFFPRKCPLLHLRQAVGHGRGRNPLLKADYIILDEFHRCGAQEWGRVVRQLLETHPQAKLLGLSATNVRYLDNNRDMAKELFDGSIASEMTLGEAIVRGILSAPKYVTTIFKYQQDLALLQQRVNNAKSPGVRDMNQKYLDALRRALEQAEGLEEVFARHITDKSGRYIVFCSGYEHMQDMMALSKEWFASVSGDIHFYSAYSEDPATSKEFSQFKADKSPALKLLFCIDMLNEGVHVKDISGVILFRPTISPIVYKQQIGRALTAGESKTPLILDIVNNFDGLCSVAQLQNEMTAAVQRMYANGESGKIITDRFEVIEQVEDCRRLFEKLETSLSNTWEQYFQAACLYAAEHGDLNVPKAYRTEAGLSLGVWIITQRRVRKGSVSGNLTESQIERLNGIGMVWENRMELAWNRNFAAAKAYYEEHGDLLPAARYKTKDGIALGAWLNSLRRNAKTGMDGVLLTPERVEQLNEMGMVWNAVEWQWENGFRHAAAYFAEHGDLNVPADYTADDGFRLGIWLNNQRYKKDGKYAKKCLTAGQIQRLEAIGMQWETKFERSWKTAYQAAKEYYRTHGTLEMPVGYKTANGIALGEWVRRQQYAYLHPEKSNAILTPERIQLLEEIGMQWEARDGWEHRYNLTRDYLAEHGDLKIPAKYKTSDGIWLGKWLYEQKRELAKPNPKRLAPEQRTKLMQLGI
ncbi:MAG: Helicase associated domain protein [Muribaculaceae bacterium]|nr:Helicase associated domain protein [Muribaculaceae bacterium]